MHGVFRQKARGWYQAGTNARSTPSEVSTPQGPSTSIFRLLKLCSRQPEKFVAKSSVLGILTRLDTGEVGREALCSFSSCDAMALLCRVDYYHQSYFSRTNKVLWRKLQHRRLSASGSAPGSAPGSVPGSIYRQLYYHSKVCLYKNTALRLHNPPTQSQSNPAIITLRFLRATYGPHSAFIAPPTTLSESSTAPSLCAVDASKVASSTLPVLSSTSAALLRFSHAGLARRVQFPSSTKRTGSVASSLYRSFHTTRTTMVATRLDGTAIAKAIRERLAAEIVEKQEFNPRYKPNLRIIQGMFYSSSRNLG